MTSPPFPAHAQQKTVRTAQWTFKDYESKYLSFDERLQLIEGMASDAECEIWENSRVLSIHHSATSIMPFDLTVATPRSAEFPVSTRALVLGTGRFGPLGPASDFYPSIFRRLEVGVRIQQPAHCSFFNELPSTDPKLTLLSAAEPAEWRTFCACQGGETVVTQTSGYWSISGRADGPSTGYSNIGFNVRLLDPLLARQLLPGLLNRLSSARVLFRVPLLAFVSKQPLAQKPVEAALGLTLSKMLHLGLIELLDKHPAAAIDAILIGPTLEGIGSYPAVTADLQLPRMSCWVVGDATGIFRGLIAAMVSGYYVGLAIRNQQTA